MRKCKLCLNRRHIHQYAVNRHGNLNGTCNICLSERSRRRYHAVVKPAAREANARKEQQRLRNEAALKHRPCSVFQGYLFAGDL